MIILEERPYRLTDTAVCIGKFDGLHSGHKLLIDSINQYKHLKKVLFTFSFPDSMNLYSTEEKRLVARSLGIDVYLDCPFSQKFSQMSPEQFLTEVLVQDCGAKVISVGEDFRFGCQRMGDVEFLKKNCLKYGYELNVFSKKKMLGDIVSSTRIRNALQKGEIQMVNRLLGRPYSIYGMVQHGNQIGRTLNMPTANQVPPADKILPPFGVYASRVCVEKKWYYGVTNIGIKPTIPGEKRAGVETCIMDFDADIYGKEIWVELYAFLRGEMRFSGLEALRAQMEEDKKNAYLFFRQ